MDQRSRDDLLRNLDRRVGRIEQVLPTLATKDEIRNLATKDEIRNLATKDEIRNLATRDELARFATKEDMLAEGVRTRAHFDAVAERLEAQIRVLAEGLMSLDQRFEDFRSETRTNFAAVDRRLLRLEARAAKEDARTR